MKKFITFIVAILLCFSNSSLVLSQEEIKLNKEVSGLYTIPCEVNGLKLRFILDTGASYVSLSLTEASFMYKNGYLDAEDFIGTTQSIIATGEVQEDYVVNLKQVKIGTKILNNVKATVSKGLSAPLLLGQSVLGQLGEWSIKGDFLVLRDRTSLDFSKYTTADWKRRINEIENSVDWVENINYLMPGVLADDYNTIIKVGDMVVSVYVIDGNLDSQVEGIIIEKLNKLSKANDKSATFELAYIYQKRAKNLDEINRAISLYEKLIDGKSLYLHPTLSVFNSAYINLYTIYNNLLNLPQKGVEFLQKGSILNESDCVSYLFDYYEDKKQYQNLYLWATKLSQTCVGYSKAKALYQKANCLMEGKGTNKNISLGVKLLEQLVISQNVYDEDALKDLCDYYFMTNNYHKVEEYATKIRYAKFFKNYYLGCAYYFMKDYASTRSYLKQLWDKDKGMYETYKFGYASCLLGTCYEEGLGGPISYKDAEKCYMYAYEECNYFAALGYLGDMMSNDKIYQNPNFEAAFGCYLQGAKNNDPYCCYRVSLCYKLGIGTNEDEKQSTYWLQKAKENGWKEQ